MMQNNDNSQFYSDSNECVSRGICTSSPIHVALQELLLLFIKHSCYYVLRLKKMGIDCLQVKSDLIKDLSALISINEFSEAQLYEIAIKYFSLLSSLKSAYKRESAKLHRRCYDISLPFEFSSDIPLYKAISLGERIFLTNYKKYSSQLRHLIEINIILLKGIAHFSLRTENINGCSFNPYDVIVKNLNALNSNRLDIERIKKNILLLARYNCELQVLSAKDITKKYGQISKTNIVLSTRKGKAILVSGDSLAELKKILDMTSKLDIDVYTHSELIIAHCLDKFKTYHNLVGHYGGSAYTSILDFATFPGAILLAGALKNSSDYLYRGRIFSNDYIVHTGVKQIENNDYTPVVNSALLSKGFKKGRILDSIAVGYDCDFINDAFKNIKSGINKGIIKHLYLISINPYSETQKEYFNNFLNLISEDEFVISFSYSSDKKNVFTINTGNHISFTSLIINEFLKNFVNYDKITFIFTTCGVMTLSSVILLNSLGYTSLYITGCPPSILNPSVFQDLIKMYGVNKTTTPQADLEAIRAK